MRKGCPRDSSFARSEESISMKLWQGRLGGDVDERLDRLTVLLADEHRLIGVVG